MVDIFVVVCSSVVEVVWSVLGDTGTSVGVENSVVVVVVASVSSVVVGPSVGSVVVSVGSAVGSVVVGASIGSVVVVSATAATR